MKSPSTLERTRKSLIENSCPTVLKFVSLIGTFVNFWSLCNVDSRCVMWREFKALIFTRPRSLVCHGLESWYQTCEEIFWIIINFLWCFQISKTWSWDVSKQSWNERSSFAQLSWRSCISWWRSPYWRRTFCQVTSRFTWSIMQRGSQSSLSTSWKSTIWTGTMYLSSCPDLRTWISHLQSSSRFLRMNSERDLWRPISWSSSLVKLLGKSSCRHELTWSLMNLWA